MNDTVDVSAVLEEAARATEAAGKKVRQPKGAAGEAAAPRVAKEPKAPKEPKVKLYVQWNEDGSPMLDAEGNRVKLPTKMEKPRVAKAPRLDADGNPIPRAVATRIPGGATISKTDKAHSFREGTKRRDHYDAVVDGMTVDAYYAATGGRAVTATFLQWYIKEGYVALGDVAAE